MHFKLTISKRGIKCTICGNKVEKDEKYFILFDYIRAEMKYPHIENSCLDCSMKISNPKFLYYVERLLTALRNNQGKVNDVKRELNNDIQKKEGTVF